MKEEYLPIGTIVILKEYNQKIMITGYFAGEKTKTLHEYRGTFYPEGITNSNKGVLFNHNSIKDIIYLGLDDEEYKLFLFRITNLSRKYTNIIFAIATKVLNDSVLGGKNE